MGICITAKELRRINLSSQKSFEEMGQSRATKPHSSVVAKIFLAIHYWMFQILKGRYVFPDFNRHFGVTFIKRGKLEK